ncbi:hypothetical protein ACMU_17175 [Actibacterium mucosum KCTC 23349]|uniref:Oxidoreductase n=1 Tax=Actibacterium mucosum KCTC 23349 TaxID=1454373 RepID=A0A037ZI32_9RHOB|nr:Gfo/Idh/MocA family oxidoreductase [Actibacterium mucosum]KAJ54445.1 hypothetical protein ACMU_17175 [Actibacterium mucosum KCTC 23349]
MTGTKIGLLGTGNIAPVYIKAAQHFPVLDLRAIAGRNPQVTKALADEAGIAAMDIPTMLADPEIEIIVNLTTPEAHFDTSMAVLEAGKHLYSEKPLGVDVTEAQTLLRTAAARGLQVGGAPDTFLGQAVQTGRAYLDTGKLGTVMGASLNFLSPGHERWHPNPHFFYQPGGGPLYDVGPYYISALVALLGPVASVSGLRARPRANRPWANPATGQAQDIEVNVDTHITGLLQMASGAIVTMSMSFDVAKTGSRDIEIYGTEGTLSLPSPGAFGGVVEVSGPDRVWQQLTPQHGFGDENYRIIGAADMAQALRDRRPMRTSGDLMHHIVEIMDGVMHSAQTGARVSMQTAPKRPAAVDPTESWH